MQKLPKIMNMTLVCGFGAPGGRRKYLKWNFLGVPGRPVQPEGLLVVKKYKTNFTCFLRLLEVSLSASCLIKGGQHILYNQGRIQQIISFEGQCNSQAFSGKYQNQNGVCLPVPSAIAKLIGYLPLHVIMLICQPCPLERENVPPTGHIMPPMGLIICP